MAVRTLLQIANQALGELGLPTFPAIVGNRDGTASQVLALLNAEGEELADIEGAWPNLRGLQTITLVPDQEAYPFPTDILYYRSGTGWDQTTHWPAWGPVSDRQWQLYQSGLSVPIPFPGFRYRIMDGEIHFYPVPTDADTVVFEYVSCNWCQGADSTPKPWFSADTDTPLIPDRLFILGLKWRLLAAKGMNYAEERAAYDAAVPRKKARAFTSSPLPLGKRRYTNLLNPGVIPEGNWPGPGVTS